MENQKGHPSHGRPSSSQDYRYPPPTTHHFPPGPSTSFHHAYTASLVAASHLEQQQQQTGAVLPQRDIITRLTPRTDNRGKWPYNEEKRWLSGEQSSLSSVVRTVHSMLVYVGTVDLYLGVPRFETKWMHSTVVPILNI